LRTDCDEIALHSRGDGLEYDGKRAAKGAYMKLQSIIRCPICGQQKAEQMLVNACRFFYTCAGCGSRLRPKAGDCCVFCSYGDVPCPPMQEAKAQGREVGCCAGARN
jgi:hypothetical protein